MLSKDSDTWVRAPEAEKPSDASPIFIVECDAMELTEFHTNRNTLIPAHNRQFVRVRDGDRLPNDPAEMGREYKRWYGGIKTWSEAVAILTNGWPEGVAQAAELSAKIEATLPEPESLRRTVSWGDDGEEVDRDRLYSSGIDFAFRRTTQKVQSAPKVIRIVANWSMHCLMTDEQIKWNGSAIIALLDVLEKADYSTELMLGFPTRSWSANNHVSMPLIRVKTAGEPLNMSAIAGIASHAGVYRSLGFAALCSTPHQMDSSLGVPISVRDACKQAVENGILEAPEAFMETSSDEKSATRNCIATLREIFAEHPELLAALDDLQNKERL